MAEFFIPSNPISLSTDGRRESSNAADLVAVAAMAATATSINGPQPSATAGSTQFSSSSLPALSISSYHQQHQLSGRGMHNYHARTAYTASANAPMPQNLPQPPIAHTSDSLQPMEFSHIHAQHVGAIPSRPFSTNGPLMQSSIQSLQSSQTQGPPLQQPQVQSSHLPPSQPPFSTSHLVRMPPPIALQAPPPSLRTQPRITAVEQQVRSMEPRLPPIATVLEVPEIDNTEAARHVLSTGADAVEAASGFPLDANSVAAQTTSYPNMTLTNAGGHTTYPAQMNNTTDGVRRPGSGSSSVEAIGGSFRSITSAGRASAQTVYDGLIDLVGAAGTNNSEAAPTPPQSNAALGKRARETPRKKSISKPKKTEVKNVDWPSQPVEDNCCTICFEEWTSEGDHRLAVLTSCGHLFGRKCVAQWLKRQKRCPNCKKRATAKEIRNIFGAPTKLCAVDTNEIETVRKELARERKAHNETRSELDTTKKVVRSCKAKIALIERRLARQKLDRDGLPSEWPSLQLVASINTQGHSKAFVFGVNGKIAYAEKSTFHPDSYNLAHSHVLQPQMASRPQGQFHGRILDMKANDQRQSPYYGSLAVVAADRHLRLIDHNYNLALVMGFEDRPMSVSWCPGNPHLLAIGTAAGLVKIFDARYIANTEPAFCFPLMNDYEPVISAPGVHSLSVHRSTGTLVAGSSRAVSAINLSQTRSQNSYLRSTPVLNNCGAGLAISNDLLMLSIRGAAGHPAMVQPYTSVFHEPTPVAAGTEEYLGNHFGMPLQGHELRRPFVRCTALVSGRYGEGGAIVATADDSRSSTVGGVPLFRGAIWSSRCVDPSSGNAPVWRMLRTREHFHHPLEDFRSKGPQEGGPGSVSFLGMLSERKLNIYKFSFEGTQ